MKKSQTHEDLRNICNSKNTKIGQLKKSKASVYGITFLFMLGLFSSIKVVVEILNDPTLSYTNSSFKELILILIISEISVCLSMIIMDILIIVNHL